MTWCIEFLGKNGGNLSPIRFIKGQYNGNPLNGKINGGVEVHDIANGHRDFYIDLQLDITGDFEITQVTTTVEWLRGYGPSGDDDYVLKILHNSTLWASVVSGREQGNQGIQTREVTFTQPLTSGTLSLRGNIDTSNVGSPIVGYLRYTRIKICGNGTNPFPVGCSHEGVSCELGIHADSEPVTNRPISLRTGEKREQVTDIAVTTPAGPLEFTRFYRQNKQLDTKLSKVMGLGWSHSHNVFLDTDTADLIFTYLPDGGRAHFRKETDTRYVAKAGGTSVININLSSTDARYTLETENQTFVFDEQKRLRLRQWENGEQWAYNYYQPGHYAAGMLEAITDGYGRSLQFSYVNAPTAFNHLQLWRVGDQTATGLEGVSPAGRFVQFTYLEEYQNGNPVTLNPKPLLWKVRDVRGKEWQYQYYGYPSGEDDSRLFNYLVSISSPEVDVTGDGQAGNPITLKRLTYSFERELAVNGDMEADGGWNSIPGAMPTFNGLSDVQVDADSTFSRHVTTSAANQGIVGEPWRLVGGRTYTITARVFAVSGAVKMQVPGLSAFDQTSIGTGVWETLAASYAPSTDVETCQLQFISIGGAGEFFVDNVSIIETNSVLSTLVQEQGIYASEPACLTTEYVFQPAGENVTTETTADKPNKYYFHNGVYGGAEDPAGHTNAHVVDNNYRPALEIDPNGNATHLQWSEDGKRLTGVQDALDHNAAFTYDYAGRLFSSVDAEAHETIYFYPDTPSDDSHRQPSLILNSNGSNLAVNGGMEADSSWASVGTVSMNRCVPASNSGQYLRRVVVNEVGEGIEGNSWDLEAGISYVVTARVYPLSGTVRMQVTNTTAFNKTTSGTGIWQTLQAVYTPTASSSGHRLQFVSTTSPAEFYVDSVAIRKAGIELALNGSMEGDGDWTNILTPTVNERALGAYAGEFARRVIATAATSGVQGSSLNMKAGRAYLIVAQVYPVSGTVRMKVSSSPNFDVTTTETGKWQLLKVAYKLTQDLNNVQLQFLSDGGAAEFYVDTVHILDSTMLLRWQEFTYNGNDRVLTEQTFDPANPPPTGSPVQQVTREYYTSGVGNGLLWKVIQDDIGGLNDVTTTYFYDSVGRVTQTNQTSNFGSCSKSRTVYDEAGNVVATLCNFEPGTVDPIYPITVAQAKTLRQRLYNTGDPDHYTDSNTNRLTIYEYDTLGRHIKTINNAEDASYEQITLTLYDALDRVIRAINNYMPDESVPHPYTADRTDFDHGMENDQNLVMDTAYNARGMVRKQVDVLGNTTLYVYDDTGRLVKTVQSASHAGHNNDYVGTSPDPMLANYVYSSDPDRDIVTTQAYDAVGNLVKMVDPIGGVTYTAYDALNHPVKTIRNASQPNYDLSLDPDLGDYIPSMDADKDVVTHTVYDALGRVQQTEDALGAITRLVYDSLGRQVKTIANYVVQGSTDPINWIWVTDHWENGSGSAIVHGTANDQNLISETVYGSDGRVEYTRDNVGRVTRHVYDGLGRVIRVVSNYVDQGEDPVLWVWNNGWKQSNGTTPINHGSNNDQNQVSTTLYDDQGRVWQTLDHRNNIMRYVYDSLGRQVKTVVNYVAQGSSDPANWVWLNNQWENGAGQAVNFGTDSDQNRITATTYDQAGRVSSTRDAAGVETRYEYDRLGRRIKTITNYVEDPSTPEQNLSSTTTYNLGGQVISTTDVRGTQTDFVYDRAGRRITVIQAVGTPLESRSYTCYDKAGRVLRVIQNWIPVYDGSGELISPDEHDGSGNWLFAPQHHGQNNDCDLVTTYTYDLASRRLSVTDPLGNATATTYFKDGQAESIRDPENLITQYRYDRLRRRTRVVQGFVIQGEDPALWVWSNGWKQSNGTTAIQHTDGISPNEDRNIIVDVSYDKAGRVINQRNSQGKVTRYVYDNLDRRLKTIMNYVAQGTPESDPVTWFWDAAQSRWEYPPDNPVAHGVDNDQNLIRQTHYNDSGVGTMQTQLTDVKGIDTTHDFDHLGRLASIQYGDPANTPDVNFIYDAAGNRRQMIESNGVSTIRQTEFDYDALHRLTSAEFDNNGDGTDVKTVNYEYDAGGLRTKLTMPDDLSITYTYDQRGQLVSLTDWDGQHTQLSYDQAGRHIATQRSNGLCSRYEYDATGHLQHLRHHERNKLLGRFAYQVDGRGNRKQVFEQVAHPSTVVATLDKANVAVEYYQGVWSDEGNFKVATQFEAAMRVTFTGNEARLTLGTGPDHSIFDIYIDGSLWESFDGYASAVGERSINIYLTRGGAHVVNIRNRPERNAGNVTEPPVYKVGFKQLEVLETTYDQQTIQYDYDALSRLLDAQYYPGTDTSATMLRHHQFTYDRAGNRLSESIALNGGAPTVTNYSYNAANQLTDDGTNTYEYDPNGNLWKTNGVETHTWDRANRLVSAGGAAYVYDGEGHRISQTVSSLVTQYLLDVQPGLAVVLAATQGADTTRYVHSVRGILAQKNPQNEWGWMVQDGLGSVRGVVSDTVDVLESRLYSPYGEPFGATGTNQTSYGFTGEPMDDNGLLYLRARYLSSQFGNFLSLDPFEGVVHRPMSLNGYSYVEGNPVNWTDAGGMKADFANLLTCTQMLEENCCPDWVSEWGWLVSATAIAYRILSGCRDCSQSSTTPPVNATLPTWFSSEKSKICDDLCKKLTSNDYSGLSNACKSHTNQICHLLCNNEPEREVESYAHKGVLQRWQEFFINEYRLGRDGRRGHERAYQAVQDELGGVFLNWTLDNCAGNNAPADVKDFDRLARKWRNQTLYAVSPLQEEPVKNGLQYVCLPFKATSLCGLAWCSNEGCSLIFLPVIQ